jgi:alpha-L-fucosidase
MVIGPARKAGAAAPPSALPGTGGIAPAAAASGAGPTVPSYLGAYESDYRADPRAAALKWFREARFGMFIHYGLYSLLGRHEWVQFREQIPVAEYAKLKDKFTAEKFSADAFADLALAAGMKYLNITTRHHDSFCLFRTKQTEFNSLNSPARRDLVGELADACRKKGLGMFFYYSHGRDWKHPHAPNNDDWGGSARPKYKQAEPTYATGAQHDLQKYLDFMTAQITELLTQYGPVGGIWLDGIAVPLSGDKQKFRCQELYDLIHRSQPQVLVSYKQGLLGTEDFFAPEHKGIANPQGKPMEICTTLQKGGWGYVEKAVHLTPDEAMQALARAAGFNANLLLNTGPLGDGSIHPDDVATLREVGKRLKENGFPKAPATPTAEPAKPAAKRGKKAAG